MSNKRFLICLLILLAGVWTRDWFTLAANTVLVLIYAVDCWIDVLKRPIGG